MESGLAKRKSSLSLAFGFSEVGMVEALAPARILILNDGKLNWEGMEDWKMDGAMADSIIGEFQKHGTDLPIDYEHASAENPGEKGIKAVAAGWIKKLSWVPGEGLYGDVEWTDIGKMEVETKQYKYISPVIVFDKKTKAIEKLHSVALTNKPRTINQRELLAASLGVSLASGAKDKVMDLKALKAQLAALGVKLDDDATDEAVLAAATEHLGKLKTAQDAATATEAVAASVRVKLGLAKDADVTAISGKLDELKTNTVDASEYAAVKARLESIELTAKARESQECIAWAIEHAKLNPNNEKQMAYAREHAKRDPSDFKKWAEAAPELYPVGRVVKPGDKGDVPPAGTREGIIAASQKEYAENKDKLDGIEVGAFVNQELCTAGLKMLTADERKALKA